ncbi:MAG: SprB repeat-containing protein, partial [Phaeodactylibacter sp.]|nr:SprB repeat-containing protein [Phaeodactylibacter sp.]
VYLQAPNGAILELTTENGGSGDFYTNTCFTPDAAQSILSGSSPYTGNWQPEGNWADLTGTPITGTWNLLVADDSGLAAFGTLNNWSITFQSINAITYSWNPATGLDCVDCPAPVATPLQTTLYEVTAQDSYNCLTTDNIEVGVAQPVGAPIVDCSALVAGEIVFTWAAVDTFTLYEVNVNNTGWIPANGNLMHTLSSLPNGSFVELRVRVYNDGTICAADIGIAACITCEIDGIFDGASAASCFGVCDGSMEVHGESGTAPYTYTIFHEDGLYTYSQTSGLFTDLCPGVNLVIVEDASGCTDTVSTVIDEPLEITLDAFQTQFINCNGGNNGGALVEATGGAGTFSYLWNDPLAQILPFATQLQAGTYTVIVTDANNCQATTTVDIIEPALLEIDFEIEDVLCFGGDSGSASAIVTGGTYPYDYQWDDPLYTQDSLVLDLTANTYAVVVTDANGCVSQASTQITQPLTPLFAASEQTFVSCYGTDNSQATVSASGGTGPNYTYTWDNGQVGFQASNLDPGATSVTITDANNCQLVETLQIVQYDSIDILAIFTPVTCHGGNDGALAVTNVDGGTGSGILTYSWSTNPGLNASILSNLTGGQSYTVTVTDDQ